MTTWTLDRRLRYLQLETLLERYAGPGRVLELGAGEGGLAARDGAGGRPVTTVDLNRAPGVGVVADGTALPFRDGAFATAICVDVLEHVPIDRRPALVAELRRVTTGTLVVGGPTGPDALAADRSLLDHARARPRRPVPEWLVEHDEIGAFPVADELRALGPPVLHEEPGLAIWAHRGLTRLRTHRGMTRAERMVPDRWLGAVARGGRRGRTYRSLWVYDLAPVTFSVIMATRDRADRLDAAARSVLAQSDRDLELVLVDDASSDDTPAVCARLAAADHRVRVVRRDRPSGSCGLARNTALDHVRGEFVAFCDDDVAWHPDHLARCRAALRDADACTTRAERFLPDGRRLDVVGSDWGEGRPTIGGVDANTIVVRRSRMVPFPDGSGRYGSEDVRLVRRLSDAGVRFAHVPAVTVDYWFNPESHCYRYDIVDTEAGPVVTSHPRVRGVRAAVGRVAEAVSVRVGAAELRA
jgi:SAM-dependent methyltransferase